MVSEFQAAHGRPCPESPTDPDSELRELLARISLEEALEESIALVGSSKTNDLHVSIMLRQGNQPPGSLVDIVRESTDSINTSLGVLVACGVDADSPFHLVHQANMAKVGGGYDITGKVQKPPGWQPPDIQTELKFQGWEPNEC